MWISGWICLALFASFGLLTRFYFKLRHLRSINVILETSFAVVFIVSPLVQSFPNAIRAKGPDQTHNSPYSNNKRGPFLNKWFVNFVLNNFAVHANSKFQFVRVAVSKVHSQILTIQNKPQRKPNCQLEIPWHKKMFSFLSYVSFHSSYSTKLFLHFMWCAVYLTNKRWQK